jgi:hypothetical protein
MPDDRNRVSLGRRRAFYVWVAPCDWNTAERRDGNVDLLLNGRDRVKEYMRCYVKPYSSWLRLRLSPAH